MLYLEVQGFCSINKKIYSRKGHTSANFRVKQKKLFDSYNSALSNLMSFIHYYSI